MVVTISKKMMERSPSRPTWRKLECPAMPTTSVANSSGAMIVLIKRRKMSASTRRCVAALGKSCPISAPNTMAMKIHALRVRLKQP